MASCSKLNNNWILRGRKTSSSFFFLLMFGIYLLLSRPPIFYQFPGGEEKRKGRKNKKESQPDLSSFPPCLLCMYGVKKEWRRGGNQISRNDNKKEIEGDVAVLLTVAKVDDGLFRFSTQRKKEDCACIIRLAVMSLSEKVTAFLFCGDFSSFCLRLWCWTKSILNCWPISRLWLRGKAAEMGWRSSNATEIGKN